MELNMVKLPTKRPNLFLRVAKGHFATSHSHINYYIDVTLQKTRLSEAQAVAQALGAAVLRDADEAKFVSMIPQLRRQCGDRAVLRAYHFFNENRRAVAEADALDAGDFAGFLNVLKESGRSSYQYLQNVCVRGAKDEQAVAVSLAVAEMALGGEGAVRVHGGGFAGTIQAFVPQHKLARFVETVDAALGEGACHVLAIRPEGGITLIH